MFAASCRWWVYLKLSIKLALSLHMVVTQVLSDAKPFSLPRRSCSVTWKIMIKPEVAAGSQLKLGAGMLNSFSDPHN
jgi:hypothetical protein